MIKGAKGGTEHTRQHSHIYLHGLSERNQNKLSWEGSWAESQLNGKVTVGQAGKE